MQKEKKIKLLIITQKVDRNDDVLGFFHGWITEFAKHVEEVTVLIQANRGIIHDNNRQWIYYHVSCRKVHAAVIISHC